MNNIQKISNETLHTAHRLLTHSRALPFGCLGVFLALLGRHIYVAIQQGAASRVPLNPFDPILFTFALLATVAALITPERRRFRVKTTSIALAIVLCLDLVVRVGFVGFASIPIKNPQVTEQGLLQVEIPRTKRNADLIIEGPHGPLAPNDWVRTMYDGDGAYHHNRSERAFTFTTLGNKPFTPSQYSWRLVPSMSPWIQLTICLLGIILLGELTRKRVPKR